MAFFTASIYHNCFIKLLILFKPAALFERINQLNWYKETLRQWIDDQKLRTKGKILEVGCATGALTSSLVKAGYSATGVDASDQMIKFARRSNKDIDFIQGNALDLPFATGLFDAVVSASLLNIVSDKIKVVSELARVCNDGGVVTVLVPSAQFDSAKFKSLCMTLNLSGFSRAAIAAWHKMPPKMHFNEIESLFDHSGLTNISKKYYLNGMVVSVSGRKS